MKQIITYVVFMNDGKHFKIGKTKNLESRIRQHQGSNPFIDKVNYFNDDVENYMIRCCKLAFNHYGREWFEGYDYESTLTYLNHLMSVREEHPNECEAVDFIREALEKVEFKQGINETE